MATINRKLYHKMQKMVGTKVISTWAKANTWALPHTHGNHPSSIGPRWASFVFQEPMIVQPQESNEPPYLKGVITAIFDTSWSFPWAPSSELKKIHKRKKAYKEGWKNQGWDTSRTTIAPSYTLYTLVWASRYLAAPMPQYVAQDFLSHSLLRFTYLSLSTPIGGMYLGYTIPFKGWNQLLRYLANPLWRMDTLAHAKAPYGRACHYKFTTLLSIIFNLFYTISLMACCTGRLGDAMVLIHNFRRFPLGFGLPIRGLTHIGLYWHI